MNRTTHTVGRIETAGGTAVLVSVVVMEDGRGMVALTLSPRDARRSGETTLLSEAQYVELKAVLARAEQTAGQLRATGQMR